MSDRLSAWSLVSAPDRVIGMKTNGMAPMGILVFYTNIVAMMVHIVGSRYVLGGTQPWRQSCSGSMLKQTPRHIFDQGTCSGVHAGLLKIRKNCVRLTACLTNLESPASVSSRASVATQQELSSRAAIIVSIGNTT